MTLELVFGATAFICCILTYYGNYGEWVVSLGTLLMIVIDFCFAFKESHWSKKLQKLEKVFWHFQNKIA